MMDKIHIGLRRPCWRVSRCGLQHATLLLLLATVSSTSPSPKKASFEVRANVQSGWPRTPEAAQSLEWLRDVDPAKARGFLRELGGGGSLSGASARLRAASSQTFHELVVRNSYYSPRIEALRSVERRDRRLHGAACAPGAAWALVWRAGAEAPAAACDAASLAVEAGAALAAGGSVGGPPPGIVRLELDLALRGGDGSRVVVLYGALSAEGLPGLAPLLRAADALDDTAWTVLFRHADGPSGPEGPGADSLTGYGFELAIKSSEYKTHADEGQGDEGAREAGEEEEGADDGESAEPERQGQEQEPDGPVELDGLLFGALQRRHPALRARLRSFREQLEAERDTDAELKAWEIKDIGLQAAARIRSSATPLLALMRLSQNFPAHVVGLARTPVPEDVRRGARELRRMMREGAEVFSVNSRLVRPDHAELSLFPIAKMLQPLFVGVERLVGAGVSEALACELLKESHPVKAPERLEWRSPFLPPASYLVTKDKRSQRWGSDLQHLVYAFPGGLAPVRLPLYSVVFVFDPAEADELQQASLLLEQTPLPASIHFVMLPGGGQGAPPRWEEAALGARPEWLREAAAGGGDPPGGAATAIAASYGALLARSPRRARAYLKGLAAWARDSLPEGGHARWPDSEEAALRMKELAYHYHYYQIYY